MSAIVGLALKFRALIAVLFGLLLLAGTIAFVHLNIESYPDPVPPLVDRTIRRGDRALHHDPDRKHGVFGSLP